MSNLFILLFIVYSIIEWKVLFHLAWPCATPSVFARMVNESMPWHNQVKEGERSWDKKMAPNQLYLYLSLL
jgi:hypothetical protein